MAEKYFRKLLFMRKIYYKKKGEIQITRADYWFSRYIRVRDSFDNGFVRCCTCGKITRWEESQCGHFVVRNKTVTRFNEQNAHPQCVGCNIANNGEQARHGIYIDKKYGVGTAQKLLDLSDMRGQRQFSDESLKEIAVLYRNLFNNLIKEKKYKEQKNVSRCKRKTD